MCVFVLPELPARALVALRSTCRYALFKDLGAVFLLVGVRSSFLAF